MLVTVSQALLEAQSSNFPLLKVFPSDMDAPLALLPQSPVGSRVVSIISSFQVIPHAVK